MELIKSTFDNRTITTLTYRGKPAWIANEVGDALGYAARKLVNRITSDWIDEMIDGHDFCIVKGSELRDLKKVVPEYGTTYAPSMMLLFESGINMVIAKTNKPAGKRFRRFLVDEVMPQLTRTGSYHENGAPANDRLGAIFNTVASQSEAMLALFEDYKTVKDTVGKLAMAEANRCKAETEAKASLNALPSPTVDAAQKTTRALVNEKVRSWAAANGGGTMNHYAWSKLYKEFKYRYHFDAATRASNAGKSKLDIIDEAGHMESLYAVACDVFV